MWHRAREKKDNKIINEKKKKNEQRTLTNAVERY